MSFEIIEEENKQPINLYTKLFYIQQKLQAPKDQFNKDVGFSYRSAEDILGAVKPLLDEQGLIITLNDDIVQIGDRYYVKATAGVTDIKSGESVETHAWAREESEVTGMRESQITGASSSYARKYALNGLFAIDDVKDADATNKGTGGSGHTQPVNTQSGRNIQSAQNLQGAPRQVQQVQQPQTQRAARQAAQQPLQGQPQYGNPQTISQNQSGNGFQIHKT